MLIACGAKSAFNHSFLPFFFAVFGVFCLIGKKHQFSHRPLDLLIIGSAPVPDDRVEWSYCSKIIQATAVRADRTIFANKNLTQPNIFLLKIWSRISKWSLCVVD